jgi:hypothetical protein
MTTVASKLLRSHKAKGCRSTMTDRQSMVQ